ncbi:DNA-directed RNA polymerase [Spironucleus salmonicida]|uniref:DNA-directed RNA polymerases I, II, and III subunit RPABC5 n=1 Tax=Spironucleus salmonicida TaxID=348837 RepID=V6LL37_9EUKA|nr:DNA-directed RNA polymerase [Spironucleus salmonicida]|eukprot:EST41394.1 DNA-directed RNA polymerase [Spironucleus salmonicida]
MIIPVRCFTCGKVVGHLYDTYIRETEQNGRDPKEVLDELNCPRYCCRRMLITHVDLIDDLIMYSPEVRQAARK